MPDVDFLLDELWLPIFINVYLAYYFDLVCLCSSVLHIIE